MKGLLPPGIHSMSAKDFVRLTCFNISRCDLYNIALKELANFLAKNHIANVFVDGSYLEEKEYPNDIDAFFEMTEEQYNDLFVIFSDDSFSRWHDDLKNIYSVDAYPSIIGRTNVKNQGRQFETEKDYWLWKFGTSKDNHEKGIAYLKTTDILMETPS